MNREQNKKYNEIAFALCSKKTFQTFKDCLNNSNNNKICSVSEKCIIKEKSIEQIDYISSSICDNIYLESCPGGGKTEVVGIKAAYEMCHWKSKHQGMAILSFTNNSTKEIKDRVNKFIRNTSSLYPHYVGTLDSWIHKYIAQPFGHLITEYKGNNGDKKIRLIDENSNAKWLNGMKSKTHYYKINRNKGYNPIPILPNHIFYDYQKKQWCFYNPINNSKYFTVSEYFNSDGMKMFRKTNKWMSVKKIEDSFVMCKNKFLKSGFATYYDMKYISYRILCKRKEVLKLISKRFPVLIIDESQDLSFIDIMIIKKLMELDVNVHLLGDVNQSIYSFRRVFPENITDFTSKSFNNMKLETNFRSCSDIVNTCFKLLRNEEVESYYETNIKKPCQVFTLDYSKISEVPGKYIDILQDNNIPIKDSAIIARGWSVINSISSRNSEFHRKKEVRLASLIKNLNIDEFKKLDTSMVTLGELLSEMIFKEHICSKNNYYKPDSIESEIQWREFLFNILEKLNQTEDLKDMGIPWSGWLKKTKAKLNKIIEVATIETNIYKELDEDFKIDINLRSPSGYAKETVNSKLKDNNRLSSSVRQTTIHQIKGETLKAILLISSKNSSGSGDGYWKNWIGTKNGEANRFAYVASSRPKDLLIWVISNKDKKDIDLLEEYGFVYMGDILEY